MNPLAAPWVRFGLIAGIIALLGTLAADLAITWFRPADLCQTGPVIIPLFNLGALFLFLLMAAAAGFATGRAAGSATEATLAGFLVGVISGCAVLLLVPFGPRVYQRLVELSSLCPNTPSSFGFGTPPPGTPTPPPGFFTTPPPEAFAPPSGSAGIALAMIGALVTVGFGVALATGIAALAGLVGKSTRSQSPPVGTS
jgi:hypothetical protein